MSMVSDLEARNDAQLKKNLITIRLQLTKAGLLNQTTCSGCGGDHVVLAHAVAQPRSSEKEHLYQPMTISTVTSKMPIALVCSDCGLVLGTLVPNPQDFYDGLSIQELSKL